MLDTLLQVRSINNMHCTTAVPVLQLDRIHRMRWALDIIIYLSSVAVGVAPFYEAEKGISERYSQQYSRMFRHLGKRAVRSWRAAPRRHITRALFASQNNTGGGHNSSFNFAFGALPIAALFAINELFKNTADNCGIVGTFKLLRCIS